MILMFLDIARQPLGRTWPNVFSTPAMLILCPSTTTTGLDAMIHVLLCTPNAISNLSAFGQTLALGQPPSLGDWVDKPKAAHEAGNSSRLPATIYIRNSPFLSLLFACQREREREAPPPPPDQFIRIWANATNCSPLHNHPPSPPITTPIAVDLCPPPVYGRRDEHCHYSYTYMRPTSSDPVADAASFAPSWSSFSSSICHPCIRY